MKTCTECLAYSLSRSELTKRTNVFAANKRLLPSTDIERKVSLFIKHGKPSLVHRSEYSMLSLTTIRIRLCGRPRQHRINLLCTFSREPCSVTVLGHQTGAAYSMIGLTRARYNLTITVGSLLAFNYSSDKTIHPISLTHYCVCLLFPR